MFHTWEVWEKKLGLLSETLDEWTQCQKNWMYLETIFSAEDIQKQLPVEAHKFDMVDKMWKTNLKAVNLKPNVIASIEDGDKLLREFQHCNQTLEDVQKQLEDYLQTKRMAFPRFYFLSNDDLLEILYNSGASIAVSVTGIAGPGGSDHKPEGRVCFGITISDQSTKSETVEFGPLGRNNVRHAARDHALLLLKQTIDLTQ